MKPLIPFCFLLFIGLPFTAAHAQDYTVTPKAERINSAKYDGFSVLVNGPLIKVEEQVYSYLKERSKVRRKRNHYLVSEFTMDKVNLDSTEVFVKVGEKGSQSSVWMGAGVTGLEDDRISEINKAIEAELVLLARSYYVHQQELKIKEAEAAAQVISKRQQDLINENGSLSKQLEDAEARKIELENMLEANKLKIASLKQRLIDNKAEQDTAYIDLQKVNTVIQGHKNALKKIN